MPKLTKVMFKKQFIKKGCALFTREPQDPDPAEEPEPTGPNADLISIFMRLKEHNKDHKFKAAANDKVGISI